MNSQDNPQQRIILNLLERIQQRLWLTRLLERSAVTLAFGSVLAICLVLARWVLDWNLPLAVGLALVPALAAVVGLIGTARRNYRGRLFNTMGYVFNRLPGEVRVLTVVCMALSFAAAIFLALPWADGVTMWMIAAVAAAVCLLAGFFTLPRISHRATAIFVDQQAGLKEKVATAFEWANVKSASTMEEGFRAPLLQSAVEACQKVQIARAGYARLDQRVYAITIATILGAAALTLLQPLQAQSHGTQHPLLVVSKASDTLADALAQLEKQHKDPNSTAEKLVKDPLRQLATTVNQSDDDVSKLDKEMQIAQQEKEFKEMQERQDADEAAQKELSTEQALGNLAKAAEEMRQAEMQEGQAGAGEAKAKAQKDIEQAAAEAGEKMSSGQMTAGQKEKLKTALAKAANDSKKDPQLKQSLEAAAKAVDKNDPKGLEKNMTAAGSRMGEQTGQKAMTKDELASAVKALDQAAQDMNSGGMSKAEQEAGQKGGNNGGSESAQNGGGDQNGAQSGDQNGGQKNADGQSGNQGNEEQSADGQQNGSGQQGSQSGQQAGQPGGQQSGQQNGSDGQSASAGQGSQQSSKQGNGNGAMASGSSGESQGSGSTNLKEDGAPGSHNNGNKVGSVGTFVKIYGEKPIANSGSTNKVVGKINPGGAVGTVDVQGMADKADGTLIDYSKELPAARQAAENAIAKDKIPPQYRDFIREYFDEKK